VVALKIFQIKAEAFASLMLKRDRGRWGPRPITCGSAAGVIGCVAAQKSMNGAAAVKVRCISNPPHPHKREVVLHHL